MNQIAKTTPAAMAATLFGVRSDVDAAQTPREARAAQVKAETIRDLLNKAMDVAGDEAPHLAQLRREAEQVAVNAMLKLGALAPEPSQGARTDLGGTSATVAEVAAACGVSRSTLRNYRGLHEAHAADPERFAAVLDRALSAGRPAPLGELRRLATDEAESPPEPRKTFLGDAVDAALLAVSLCRDVANNEDAPERVRGAARAYADGVRQLCEQLRFALNGEA